MSTTRLAFHSPNMRIPLTIPASLATSTKYTIQFSIHSLSRDMDIFLPETLGPSDLVTTTRGSVALLQREELPSFSDESERELQAHFWVRERCVETVGCGRI